MGSDLGRLLEDVDSLTARELGVRLQDAERLGRRVEAIKAALVAEADRTGGFREDGHLRVSSWVQATVRVSRREALDMARLAAVATALPVVFDHLAAGTLGTRQAGDLARVYANPRIGDALLAVVESFVTVAERVPYDQFVSKLNEWAQLVDADGSHRDADLAHERRSAHLTTLGTATFLDMRVGAVQGEALTEVLEGFERAEFETDWAETKARYGDDATPDLMPRTAAQRRADAIVTIFQQAATTDPDTTTTPLPLVNLVMTQPVYDEQLAAIIERRQPVFDTSDPAQLWCTTTSGTPVDPAVAIALSLIGHVRRIIIDTAGRVIDVGRKQRTFTAGARDGALVQAVLDGTGGRCLWPGCGRRRNQLDHTDEWHRDRGCSDLHNTGWLCRIHNVLKTHGYRTWRDPHGTWHLTRPDGTTIEAA